MNPMYSVMQKGKSLNHTEFSKKSLFGTHHGDIIIEGRAPEVNAFDGYTLKPKLQQVRETINGKALNTFVDHRYRVCEKQGLQK